MTPFSGALWGTLVAAWLATAWLMFILERHSPYDNDFNQWCAALCAAAAGAAADSARARADRRQVTKGGKRGANVPHSWRSLGHGYFHSLFISGERPPTQTRWDSCLHPAPADPPPRRRRQCLESLATPTTPRPPHRVACSEASSSNQSWRCQKLISAPRHTHPLLSHQA